MVERRTGCFYSRIGEPAVGGRRSGTAGPFGDHFRARPDLAAPAQMAIIPYDNYYLC